MCRIVTLVRSKRGRGYEIVAELASLRDVVAYFGAAYVTPADTDGLPPDADVCLCNVDVPAIAARAGWHHHAFDVCGDVIGTTERAVAAYTVAHDDPLRPGDARPSEIRARRTRPRPGQNGML